MERDGFAELVAGWVLLAGIVRRREHALVHLSFPTLSQLLEEIVSHPSHAIQEHRPSPIPILSRTFGSATNFIP